MLDEITASNLGLIASAAIRPAPGLTVITGETGTGKTLMLGALRLLRGEKASKSVIGPHADACDVSARFIDGDAEHVARRRVDATRSRAYLDGSAATASDLADALAHRVEIVGQHDQITITSSHGVRSLVDRRLDDAGIHARDAYATAWAASEALRAEADELGGDLRALERDRDIAAYQMKEIDAVGVDPDTDTYLRQRVMAMRNADAVAASLDTALAALGDDAAGRFLDEAMTALRTVADIDSDTGEFPDRAEEIATLLNELSRDVATRASQVDADPAVLAAAEQRLAVLGDLKRKYGETLEDVISFRKQAEETHRHLTELLVAASDIDERSDAARHTLVAVGADLLDARRRSADRVSTEAVGHLRDLGFTDPIVAIDVRAAEPSQRGADTMTVRFASAAGLEPAPISAVASGGEMSRLVLALTLASGSFDTATLAFDEIDTGIGGATALAMGEKLKALSRRRQVLCVTHLPQVAAFADVHVRVDRVDDTAVVEHLADDGRIRELTRMLAGLSESAPGIDHARELLAHAGQLASDDRETVA